MQQKEEAIHSRKCKTMERIKRIKRSFQVLMREHGRRKDMEDF
jgi:hypothetical protein